MRAKRKVTKRPLHSLSNLIFFLNVMIALLIVTGTWFLRDSEFGQSVIIFSFLMLCVSILMKVIGLW